MRWAALLAGPVLLTTACSGIPAGLPGTATCTIGRAERTYQCRTICGDVAAQNSASEREDLRLCAEEQCNVSCQ